MRDYRALLRAIAPHGNPGIRDAVAGHLATYLPQYAITAPKRLPQFLAQAAEESDGFKTLHEYASGKAYEGRKDLGNVRPGDGVRFKGRGIFELTGRVNYAAYGKRLGLDLVSHPDMAADPEVSVRVACEYWKAKGLNGWADRDDINEITRRINGGHNGLAQRKAYLAKTKAALAKEEAEPEAEKPEAAPLPRERPADAPKEPAPKEPEPPQVEDDTPTEEVPDAPIAAERKKTGVTETGAVVAGGSALDTMKTASDAINTASETKQSVENLGVGDWLIALASNPRFLVSAIFLVAIVGGVVWWHFFRKGR